MKKLFFFSALTFVFLFAACGDEDKTSSSQGDQAVMNEEGKPADTPSNNATNNTPTAICLWNLAGVRDKPGRGKDAKYITGIQFGEKVNPTGSTAEAEDEKRVYMEVELSDGKKGWVNQYLLAEDATLAAVSEKLQLYKRPDLTTMQSENFEPGDVIALGEVKGDFQEATGFQKKKTGWIKAAKGVETGPEDIVVALLYQRALMLDSGSKRKKQLEAIAGNSDFQASPFMQYIKSALEKIGEIEALPADKMRITSDKLNARSEPDNTADNVVFQLNDGDVVAVLEKGAQQKIREMNDYWYKVKSGDKVGWIYGWFTSKRAE